MLHPQSPISRPEYSANLENFNLELVQFIKSLSSQMLARDGYNYAYVQLLQEAKSIGECAETIRLLCDRYKYLESLTLVRKLVERILHYKASNNFELIVNYLTATDEAGALAYIKSRGDDFSIHECVTTAGKSPSKCIQFKVTRTSASRYPMSRYIQMAGKHALGHNFTKGYRQYLWSFVDEGIIREDNRWMYKHYTSFSGIVRNLEEINVLSPSDRAKLETHFGFLSAISHSPFELANELHGHNGVSGTFYGPTNRLINLYIGSTLTLVLESLLPWVVEYEFILEEKIFKANKFLESKDKLLSELGFPFSEDHAFDSWRRNLPGLAQELHREVPMDLTNEYLDPDFLARIESMHTAYTELSVGKTWMPHDLFGVDD